MVAEELVRAAYLLLLGREPENQEVVTAAMGGNADWQSLRWDFLNSLEFRRVCSPSVITSIHDEAPHIHVESETDPHTLARMLDRVQTVWNRLGEEDPYWSVLTSERFRKDKFHGSSEEFWNSGEDDLKRFTAWMQRNELCIRGSDTVLEYGCGTGRVTMWLARMFSRVIAYDISRTHLQLAEEHLARVNETAELRHISIDGLDQLPKVDVIFSTLVLQHNPPPVIRHILGCLLGALTPGGIAYLQFPTYCDNYEFRIERYLNPTEPAPEPAPMEMHVLPQRVAFEVIAEQDCAVIEVAPDSLTGSAQFVSTTFLIRKNQV